MIIQEAIMQEVTLNDAMQSEIRGVHTFFIRILDLLLTLFLNFSGFEPFIILKLFLNIEGATTSENERIISKSLLMFYFIIKQNESEAE